MLVFVCPQASVLLFAVDARVVNPWIAEERDTHNRVGGRASQPGWKWSWWLASYVRYAHDNPVAAYSIHIMAAKVLLGQDIHNGSSS